MYSENNHPLTHEFAIIRGNDDVAVSSSDSDSTPLSERNEPCSSSDEIADMEKKREYNLSDLEMDENSGSLPAFNTDEEKQSDSEGNSINFSQQNSEAGQAFIKNATDTPYDYLCSVISDNFVENDML